MTVLPTIPRPSTDAGAMSEHSSGEVPARAKRRTFTGAYKLKVLAEYEAAARVSGERCCAVRACTPRCWSSGARPVTPAHWRGWP
jgi:hypothetical protein